jgi:hypothetical protein
MARFALDLFQKLKNNYNDYNLEKNIPMYLPYCQIEYGCLLTQHLFMWPNYDSEPAYNEGTNHYLRKLAEIEKNFNDNKAENDK